MSIVFASYSCLICCIILWCIILWCVVLYCGVLYYIILCSVGFVLLS